MRIYALLALLILGACTAPHKLAGCKGPLEAMNADHWRPTLMELTALDKVCPGDE